MNKLCPLPLDQVQLPCACEEKHSTLHAGLDDSTDLSTSRVKLKLTTANQPPADTNLTVPAGNTHRLQRQILLERNFGQARPLYDVGLDISSRVEDRCRANLARHSDDHRPWIQPSAPCRSTASAAADGRAKYKRLWYRIAYLHLVIWSRADLTLAELPECDFTDPKISWPLDPLLRTDTA